MSRNMREASAEAHIHTRVIIRETEKQNQYQKE